jgi:Xaa-Pro aminopeptidase
MARALLSLITAQRFATSQGVKMTIEQLEKTGPNFSNEALMDARKNTKEAISLLASAIKPGMLEEDARQMAKETLERLGSTKGWHKILIRFGTNTVKNFEDPSERNVRLGTDDIFFIDIGPVWADTEGDGGETFIVGNCDPDMKRCAEDVKRIFQIVRKEWLDSGMTGKELYDFAFKTAAKMGWVLNMELTGHRLSEFPHSAYYDGTLAAVSIRPSPNLWVLEIQVKHPSKPFGGFFEDLLLTDDQA